MPAPTYCIQHADIYVSVPTGDPDPGHDAIIRAVDQLEFVGPKTGLIVCLEVDYDDTEIARLGSNG